MQASSGTKFTDFDRHDLVYSTINNVPIHASVLLPRTIKEETSCPVLVYWHGGGFVTGDRMYEPWWAKWLIELAQSQNAIIVTADYRLLPEASGGDVLDDVITFWQWYKETLPQIARSRSWIATPDVTRTLCTGQSAGAYIAVHSAIAGLHTGIQAVVAMYGALNFDAPIVSMVQPRVIGGYQPPPPRQAERTIRSYIAATKGSTRTTGDPLKDWDLVASIVQQGWLPRLTKRNPDSRLDLIANVDTQKPMTPVWIIHGEQDSVVPLECSTKFVDRLREMMPNAAVLVSVEKGDHLFDIHIGMSEPWVQQGCEFVTKYWGTA